MLRSGGVSEAKKKRAHDETFSTHKVAGVYKDLPGPKRIKSNKMLSAGGAVM
jgi:hypothetical protein